jgi:CSLREA domain-containing protein
MVESMPRRSSVWRRASAQSAAVVLVILLLPAPAHAAPVAFPVYEVTSTADLVDDAPGDGACHTVAGSCTLRAAVQEANASASTVTVRLRAGEYSLTLGSGGEDDGAEGDLDVAGNVLVRGDGAADTVIRGTVDRVFHVLGGATASLSGLAIRDTSVDGNGGAILAVGDLSLTDVLLTGNSAVGDGGAVASGPGSLSLKRTTVADNQAGNSGGGLVVGGHTSILNSTISDNRVTDSGGRDGNSGGAIRVLALARVRIDFSTMVGNSAAGIGGTVVVDATGFAVLIGSIVAGAGPAHDCFGLIHSGGWNLERGHTCPFDAPTDVHGVEPLLGPLRWVYGGETGPTPVRYPAADSPVVDTVHPSACPLLDQWHRTRPRDGDGDGVARCDRGAIEREVVLGNLADSTRTEGAG